MLVLQFAYPSLTSVTVKQLRTAKAVDVGFVLNGCRVQQVPPDPSHRPPPPSPLHLAPFLRSHPSFPPLCLCPLSFSVVSALWSQVKLVGVYCAPLINGTTLRFLLDDGTGQVQCATSTDMTTPLSELWKALEEEPQGKAGGRYLRVIGKLKEDRSIQIFHALQVLDFNELQLHPLEAIYEHFKAQQTLPVKVSVNHHLTRTVRSRRMSFLLTWRLV